MPIQVRCWRSIRLFIAATTAVAVVTVLGASSALASETKTFTGLKDCNGTGPSFPAATGSCLVTKSSLEILEGGTVHYTSVAWLADRLTSSVKFTAIDHEGSTATGQCTFFFSGTGHCDYWSGTGDLTGFHATIAVGSTKSTGVYSLKGTYWYAKDKIFTGEKICRLPFVTISPPNPGGYCLVTQASLKVLLGAKDYYTAATSTPPNVGPGGAQIVDSPVTVRAADERASTASGHCTYYYPTATTVGHGLCLFTSGTGALAGFNARFEIGAPTVTGVTVIGPYWFDRDHHGDDNGDH